MVEGSADFDRSENYGVSKINWAEIEQLVQKPISEYTRLSIARAATACVYVSDVEPKRLKEFGFFTYPRKVDWHAERKAISKFENAAQKLLIAYKDAPLLHSEMRGIADFLPEAIRVAEDLRLDRSKRRNNKLDQLGEFLVGAALDLHCTDGVEIKLWNKSADDDACLSSGQLALWEICKGFDLKGYNWQNRVNHPAFAKFLNRKIDDRRKLMGKDWPRGF